MTSSDWKNGFQDGWNDHKKSGGIGIRRQASLAKKRSLKESTTDYIKGYHTGWDMWVAD